eukprot:511655-Amphidinium_carterae.1
MGSRPQHSKEIEALCRADVWWPQGKVFLMTRRQSTHPLRVQDWFRKQFDIAPTHVVNLNETVWCFHFVKPAKFDATIGNIKTALLSQWRWQSNKALSCL